jgi:exopolyphosphatase/pppGpp-phosphohydrolase
MCTPFPPDALERLFGLFSARPSEEIAAEYDLKPERARLLLPATIILREILRGYNFPPLVISPYGVREGAILSMARQRLN